VRERRSKTSKSKAKRGGGKDPYHESQGGRSIRSRRRGKRATTWDYVDASQRRKKGTAPQGEKTKKGYANGEGDGRSLMLYLQEEKLAQEWSTREKSGSGLRSRQLKHYGTRYMLGRGVQEGGGKKVGGNECY